MNDLITIPTAVDGLGYFGAPWWCQLSLVRTLVDPTILNDFFLMEDGKWIIMNNDSFLMEDGKWMIMNNDSFRKKDGKWNEMNANIVAN